jgi:hypothetical protein
LAIFITDPSRDVHERWAPARGAQVCARAAPRRARAANNGRAYNGGPCNWMELSM